MIKYLLMILFSLNSFAACPPIEKFKPIKLDYAKLFSIKAYQGSYILKIIGEHSKNSFYLSSDKNSCFNFNKIQIPVKRSMITSTTSTYPIEALNEIETVKAALGKKFIYNNKFHKKEIVSFEFPFSVESILAVRPELIFSYELNNSYFSKLENLKTVDINIVNINEYLEKHPLGRSEWVKVYGVLFDKLNISIELYNKSKKVYEENICENNCGKKQILIGEVVNDKWVAPNPKSYIVKIISDAGGQYIYNTESSISNSPLNLSFERLIKTSGDIDIWFPMNNLRSFDKMLKESGKYLVFPFFKKRISTYNNINRIKENNSNDYWESSLYRPETLLMDLKKIINNDVRDLYWFKNIK